MRSMRFQSTGASVLTCAIPCTCKYSKKYISQFSPFLSLTYKGKYIENMVHTHTMLFAYGLA